MPSRAATSFGSVAPIENRFGNTAPEVGAGITAGMNANTSLYKCRCRWSVDGDDRQTTTQDSIGIRVNW